MAACRPRLAARGLVASKSHAASVRAAVCVVCLFGVHVFSYWLWCVNVTHWASREFLACAWPGGSQAHPPPPGPVFFRLCTMNGSDGDQGGPPWSTWARASSAWEPISSSVLLLHHRTCTTAHAFPLPHADKDATLAPAPPPHHLALRAPQTSQRATPTPTPPASPSPCCSGYGSGTAGGCRRRRTASATSGWRGCWCGMTCGGRRTALGTTNQSPTESRARSLQPQRAQSED